MVENWLFIRKIGLSFDNEMFKTITLWKEAVVKCQVSLTSNQEVKDLFWDGFLVYRLLE